MKTVLLTTETAHHTYYAWKLNDRFPFEAVLIETRIPKPPFETFHPFEAKRDAYEKEVLLAGGPSRLEEIAETHRVGSVNDAEALCLLERFSPEAVIVFGTGRLFPSVIQKAGKVCLNLHGGNPEQYRGLDTHLWTIYHGDFDNLVTTLHYVDEGLDTGDIVFQSRLELTRRCQLHELRSVNTEACIHLSLKALESLEREGTLPRRKQTKRGSYFSFMPTPLKESCLEKFEGYVNRL